MLYYVLYSMEIFVATLVPIKLGMWKPLNIPAPPLLPNGTNIPTKGYKWVIWCHHEHLMMSSSFTLLYGVGEQPISSLMIFLATVSPWAPAKAAILCSWVSQQSPTAKIFLWPDSWRYSLTWRYILYNVTKNQTMKYLALILPSSSICSAVTRFLMDSLCGGKPMEDNLNGSSWPSVSSDYQYKKLQDQLQSSLHPLQRSAVRFCFSPSSPDW